MANRALLKKVKTIKDLKAYQPSSQEFKEIIFEQIRLDLPILEVGSSSIGKSRSLRDFKDKCGVEGEFLFVGTEKSEFIEGIPNLKGAVETGAQKFSYLKPYWFPDKEQIRKRLKLGRDQLNSLPKELATLFENSKKNYDALVTLKSELLKIRRDEATIKKSKQAGETISKYIYSDALAYISMLQGFGNFWLILDEIDKVEKQDKDKYAPLLHIVRERELKGWKLSGIRDYPEYDLKFVETIDDRFTRLNKAIDDPSADITDTRIIAIANDLQTMEEESPALYRRFIKIIVDRDLYDSNEMAQETAAITEERRKQILQSDPALAYETKRGEFHNCIIVKEIPSKEGRTVKDLMAYIEPEKTGTPLDELNLQWTLGFLPELLFPAVDTSKQTAGRELFIPNLFIKNWNETPDPFQTYIYKIITDNFNPNWWITMLECIDNIISFQKIVDTTAGTLKEKAIQMLKTGGMVPSTFNSVTDDQVRGVLNIYNGLLLDIEDQLKNLGPEAQKQLIESGYSNTGGTGMSGIAGSILITAQEQIQLGGYLIEASLITTPNGTSEKSLLTDKLLSSIPFIQNRLISCSPYISYTYSKDMMNYMNNTAINIVAKTSGAKNVKQKDLEEQAKRLFENTAVDKNFTLIYGMGIDPSEVEVIKNFKLGGDIEAKEEMLKKIFDRRPVIVYDTLLTKLNEEQKKAYYQSLAPFRMIQKEVFSNLPKIVGMLVKEATEGKDTVDKLERDISDYCADFPYNMRSLSEAPAVKAVPTLYDMIQSLCNENINVKKGIGSEIDRVNKFD